MYVGYGLFLHDDIIGKPYKSVNVSFHKSSRKNYVVLSSSLSYMNKDKIVLIGKVSYRRGTSQWCIFLLQSSHYKEFKFIASGFRCNY